MANLARSGAKSSSPPCKKKTSHTKTVRACWQGEERGRKRSRERNRERNRDHTYTYTRTYIHTTHTHTVGREGGRERKEYVPAILKD